MALMRARSARRTPCSFPQTSTSIAAIRECSRTVRALAPEIEDRGIDEISPI